jgi:beta-glucosidase
VAAAKKVDYVLLCLGENSYTEKPGDLHDLNLSENQVNLAKALVAVGKPIILVLNEGRPRLINAIEKDMAAIVQSYLPGNFGGDALASILIGETNPSGKLPYTYPMFANTLLTYDHKPSEEQDKMEGVYDYESDFAVQYHFGHGLSYTTFEYSDLKLSEETISADGSLKVTVSVTNSGRMAGKEVVQLYVSDLYASISPDMTRLRAFDKIMLQPGQTQKITFELTARDLAFVGKNRRWTVEKGEYEVNVGGLKNRFTINETKVYNEVKSIL